MEDNISKKAVPLCKVDNAVLVGCLRQFFKVDSDFIREISYRLERSTKAHEVLSNLAELVNEDTIIIGEELSLLKQVGKILENWIES